MNMDVSAALVVAAAAVHGFVLKYIMIRNRYVLGMGAGIRYGETGADGSTKENYSKYESQELFHEILLLTNQ